jgi:hypothetical protein
MLRTWSQDTAPLALRHSRNVPPPVERGRSCRAQQQSQRRKQIKEWLAAHGSAQAVRIGSLLALVRQQRRAEGAAVVRQRHQEGRAAEHLR